MKKTSTLITLLLLLLWTSGPSQAQTYARHGMSPAAYQQIFDSLSNKGYRLSSISGYSANGSVRYAAIWKKQGGPALVARHGLSSAAYQESFDDLSGKGYKLKTVSGYAGGNHALFAAIWTKNQGTQWAARHNMTGDVYQATFNDMYKKGYNLTQVSGYVVNGSIYFAAIWEKDNRKIAAHHNMTSSQYQDYFNDYGSKGYQLQNVSGYEKNGQNLYAAVWEKKSAPLTFARHGMSPINYQHNFDNCYYQGYEPVYINGFAADGGSRFNAIWENKNISNADMQTMDDEVNAYMQSQGIKGLSFGVTKNGRLVFAKAYGMADTDKGEELSPTHSMRIMSISKSVTAAGIMKLLEQGNISSLQRKVFGPGSIFGNDYSIPDKNKRLKDITLSQLLHHDAGLRTCNGEPEFWNKNKTYGDVIQMFLNDDNLFLSDPGTDNSYSNTGFFLLAAVIEKLSGQSYESYIINKVLKPAGVAGSMYTGNADGSIKAGETHYMPHDSPNMKLWAGFGGWVARPIDLLRYLTGVDGEPQPKDIMLPASHDSLTATTALSGNYACGWVVNGNLQNHNGAHGASRSWLAEIGNGLSIAVITNSAPSNDPGGHPKLLNAISTAAKNVTSFPNYNLF